MKILLSVILMFCFLSILVSAAPDKALEHDIKISNIIISEQSLHCSKEVLVLADVENKGSFTEDVYVELINKKLDVHAFSPSMKVYPKTREQILLPLYFSEEPQGAYTFDAYLYTGKDIQQTFATFTFSGCKTVQLTSYIQPQVSVQLPQADRSTTLPETSVDLLFVSTLFIIVLVLITASAAILRMF